MMAFTALKPNRNSNEAIALLRKQATLKCVDFSSVVIDITQIPGRENFDYGMSHMHKFTSYGSIDFFSIFNENGSTMKRLQRMVSDGIAKGWVRPLSRITYAPSDVTRAFHLLAASNHRGRVLLDMQQVNVNDLCTQPRLQCSPKRLYIIISDHADLGQQMADMLISRGVRKLRLNLPVSQEKFMLKMRHWQSIGVQIYHKCTDLQNVPGMLTDDGNILPEPVDGILIGITNKNRSVIKTTAFLETIDIMSRKMFPDLKYFSIINTVSSVGEETCKSRNIDGFAATMLRLSELNDIAGNDTPERMSVREAVDIMERAVTSEDLVLSANVISTPLSSLSNQIAAVAGVNITEDNNGNKTLLDLGMDETKAKKVSVYLRDTQNTLYTVDEILALTTERIEYIDEILTRTNFENDKGLNKLFTCVDKDEIATATDMVFLPTLTSSATLYDGEIDQSLPHLCIVPGVEGHYGRFRTLCERLKLSALVLRPDLSRPYETIPEMARRYCERLSQTGILKNHFYLLGYESGVFVVLEMAAILEEKGFTTQVFCIGNPEEIKTEVKDHLKGLETKEALQEAIVRHMFVKMSNSSTDELELALRGVSLWQEKLNVTVHSLLGKVSHSAQYTRQVIVAAYERLLTLMQYETKIQKLRSRIILLQPMSSSGFQLSALQRYSQQSVVCRELRAPLSQATDDLRCAAIINAYLDIDILEDFERKNLCSVYIDSETLINWVSDCRQ